MKSGVSGQKWQEYTATFKRPLAYFAENPGACSLYLDLLVGHAIP